MTGSEFFSGEGGGGGHYTPGHDAKHHSPPRRPVDTSKLLQRFSDSTPRSIFRVIVTSWPPSLTQLGQHSGQAMRLMRGDVSTNSPGSVCFGNFELFPGLLSRDHASEFRSGFGIHRCPPPSQRFRANSRSSVYGAVHRRPLASVRRGQMWVNRGHTWPNLLRPDDAQVRPNSDRAGSAGISRIQHGIGQIHAKVAQVDQCLAELGRIWAKLGPTSTKLVPVSSEFGQTWTELAELGQTLGRLWADLERPTSTELGP